MNELMSECVKLLYFCFAASTWIET